MIKVAVTGGASGAAGELVRLLVNHPDVELKWIHSRENAGAAVTDVHRGLAGETYMRFTDRMDWDGVDQLFVCPGSDVAVNDAPASVKIVDLTGERCMPGGHDYIYGLPEYNRKALVRGARHVACPGAVATALSLALLPLAARGVSVGSVCAAAVTGADVAAMIPDRPLRHPAAAEAEALLRSVRPGFTDGISLMAFTGPSGRGVLATVCADMPAGLGVDDVRGIFVDFYSDHSFTFVSDRPVDIRDVADTNRAMIHIEEAGARVIVTAVIDSMLKGAAGNAVHCMNLLFGLHERVGLVLKSSAG